MISVITFTFLFIAAAVAIPSVTNAGGYSNVAGSCAPWSVGKSKVITYKGTHSGGFLANSALHTYSVNYRCTVMTGTQYGKTRKWLYTSIVPHTEPKASIRAKNSTYGSSCPSCITIGGKKACDYQEADSYWVKVPSSNPLYEFKKRVVEGYVVKAPLSGVLNQCKGVSKYYLGQKSGAPLSFLKGTSPKIVENQNKCNGHKNGYVEKAFNTGKTSYHTRTCKTKTSNGATVLYWSNWSKWIKVGGSSGGGTTTSNNTSTGSTKTSTKKSSGVSTKAVAPVVMPKTQAKQSHPLYY
jgi:hypothetical protein